MRMGKTRNREALVAHGSCASLDSRCWKWWRLERGLRHCLLLSAPPPTGADPLGADTLLLRKEAAGPCQVLEKLTAMQRPQIWPTPSERQASAKRILVCCCCF